MCVAGARWAQENVLAKDPSLPLKVYVVWFDMVPGDARGRWPAGAITDPRAVHFWDGTKAVGRLVAARSGLTDVDVAWDVFLLYPAGARWDADLASPAAWGAPVLREKDKLTEGIARLRAVDRGAPRP